jgi:PhzF family phenazine biosynthesis protein
MPDHLFHEVDVFASGPFTGNPLAVLHGVDAIDDDELQRIAAWTNFSETTFLLPPTEAGRHAGADYRVRIFTPASELPFAGHPTLGTCRAWLEAGGEPGATGRVVQECGVGLVPIRVDGARLAFAAPQRIRSGPLSDRDIGEIAGALGLDPDDVVAGEWCDNGPGWRTLLVRSADAVLAVEPPSGDVGFFHVGLVGPHAAGADSAIEVRAFFNDATGSVREDPVTGSLNAAVAQWLLGAGVVEAPYVATQGARVGRAGRVEVTTDPDGTVWIGGRTEIRVTGTLTR